MGKSVTAPVVVSGQIEVGDVVFHRPRGEATVIGITDSCLIIQKGVGVTYEVRVDECFLMEKADGTMPSPPPSPGAEAGDTVPLEQDVTPTVPHQEPKARKKRASTKITVPCCICGVEKQVFPSERRKSKTGLFFCSQHKNHRFGMNAGSGGSVDPNGGDSKGRTQARVRSPIDPRLITELEILLAEAESKVSALRCTIALLKERENS